MFMKAHIVVLIAAVVRASGIFADVPPARRASVSVATANAQDGMPLPPRPEACEGQVLVDAAAAVGPIKPMHALNGAPFGKGSPMFAAWKDAEIPYTRTHDLNTNIGFGAPHAIDVPAIFPDFDADENDPKNYDFANTDAIIERIQASGTKVFFAFNAFEEALSPKKYTIHPPKDPAKWARICEHIVAHCNEGWANGHRWNIEYWEIWNEPNLRNTDTDDGVNGTYWRGPRSKFEELFKVSLRHLKGRFPKLKFGGPAFAGTGAKWGERIVKALADEKIPLDFYSWHCYTTDPRDLAKGARWVREMLDRHGFVRTENINDEWNYVKNFGKDMPYSHHVEHGRYSEKGAAFTAAALCAFQDSPTDMAMYWCAKPADMNGLFDVIEGLPMRGYYPFVVWSSLRRLGTAVRTGTDREDLFSAAAKSADGRLGVLIVRYNEDNNVTSPVRIRVALASGASLASADCHLTDDRRIFTRTPLARNADGSADLVLRPNSFAFVEISGINGTCRMD